MKPLSNNQELIKAIAIFGIVATQIMNLTSIPSMIDIIRAKSTLMYPTFPFSVSIVASTISIIYSVLSDQVIVGLSSMMTVGQCVIYESIHYYYSKQRWRIVRELVFITLIVGGTLGIGILFKCAFCTKQECSSFVTFWFGLVMAIISCVRYGAQAYSTGDVIRTKNAGSISPAMTFGALFASLAWTFYSVSAGDVYYLASGLAGTASCLLQLFLLWKYPRILKVPSQMGKLDSSETSSVVNASIVGRDGGRGEIELEQRPPILLENQQTR
jgi:uncharacterized protein with PQ loop repeat